MSLDSKKFEDQTIDRLAATFIEHLDVIGILDHCLSEGLLTNDDVGRIRALVKDNRSKDGVRDLLSQIKRSAPGYLEKFYNILINSKSNFLAEPLAEEYCKQLEAMNKPVPSIFAKLSASTDGHVQPPSMVSTLAKPKEIKDDKMDEVMLRMPESVYQLQKVVLKEIADKWEPIAIFLRFTRAEIQVIKDNCQERPTEDLCKDMLFNWLESGQSKEPAKDLIKAIKEIGFGYWADQFEKDMKSEDILKPEYLQRRIIPVVAPKWKEVGLELKIPVHKIKANTDFVSARCLQMLDIWWNRGENVEDEAKRPLWKNMYKAMCDAELGARAERLKSRLAEQAT